MIESPIAYFLRDDYEAIKRIFPQHPDFPDSYDERLYLSDKECLEDMARGHATQRVIVNSNDFMRFCDRKNINRDKVALRAFIIEEAPRQKNLPTPSSIGAKCT
jgi:hypothetical protein